MHLDEWGGGPRIVQGQNEAMKILPEEADLASTFQQQLKEENPKHAKNKAFEEDADIGHIESQLEETFKVTSQEDSRPDGEKKDRVSLGMQNLMTKNNHLSRDKRAIQNHRDHQRKKRKVKKERKSVLAREKAKLKDEIKELKKQKMKTKKEIEKLKKRKRPDERRKSKGKNINRDSEFCIEKWATFSNAAIGPAASIIKQVAVVVL